MKLRGFAAIAALLMCSIANAASGIYSGVWQASSGTFLFVMHSGSSLIVTTYRNLPATGIVITLGSGQRYVPTSLDIGDLVSGSLIGNRARVSGIAAFRACDVTYDLVFDTPDSATLVYVGATVRAEGVAQGINCAALYPAPGSTLSAIKLF